MQPYDILAKSRVEDTTLIVIPSRGGIVRFRRIGRITIWGAGFYIPSTLPMSLSNCSTSTTGEVEKWIPLSL